MGVTFVKLYGKILDSSIWLEDASTRLLWITVLAMADAEGVVRASVGGLAHRARITRAECEHGLAVLTAPDPDSQSQEEDGRRMLPIDGAGGGWVVVNHQAYRDLRTSDQVAAAARVRRHRARKRADQGAITKRTSVTVTDVTTEGEAEEEADREADQRTGEGAGFTLSPPPPKQKTRRPKTRPPCSDEMWESVVSAYVRARELGGMSARWGAYRDNRTNRAFVARMVDDGYSEADMLTVMDHIGRGLAQGTHDAKWTSLEHVTRHLGRYLHEAAAGDRPSSVRGRGGIDPRSEPKERDETDQPPPSGPLEYDPTTVEEDFWPCR